MAKRNPFIDELQKSLSGEGRRTPSEEEERPIRNGTSREGPGHMVLECHHCGTWHYCPKEAQTWRSNNEGRSSPQEEQMEVFGHLFMVESSSEDEPEEPVRHETSNEDPSHYESLPSDGDDEEHSIEQQSDGSASGQSVDAPAGDEQVAVE